MLASPPRIADGIRRERGGEGAVAYHHVGRQSRGAHEPDAVRLAPANEEDLEEGPPLGEIRAGIPGRPLRAARHVRPPPTHPPFEIKRKTNKT